MKSFLIIGAGRFGHYLCRKLTEHGNQIMLVDRDEEKMHDLLNDVTSARIGDCTHEEVLQTFGVEDFDACIVCIEEHFQNSLEVTWLLHQMGAKKVCSLAATEIQAKFLLRNGADEVIFPDRDMAERLAMRLDNDSIFDYIEITSDHSIFEITVPQDWIGKTIAEVEIRRTYHVSVLAAKRGDRLEMITSPDYRFAGQEHLLVMGKNEDVERMLP